MANELANLNINGAVLTALQNLDKPEEIVTPLPADMEEALNKLAEAVKAEMPEQVQIFKHIHAMLVASGEALYLMNDEQIATLYDVLLPRTREQITPVKQPKAAGAPKPKSATSKLNALLKNLVKDDGAGDGQINLDDF